MVKCINISSENKQKIKKSTGVHESKRTEGRKDVIRDFVNRTFGERWTQFVFY